MYKNTPNKHVFHKLQPKQKHLPGLKNITKYFYNLIFLFLQFEGVLDTGELGLEGLIHLQALLDGVAAVDDRRVVAVADELSNATRRHLRIFLSQIH